MSRDPVRLVDMAGEELFQLVMSDYPRPDETIRLHGTEYVVRDTMYVVEAEHSPTAPMVEVTVERADGHDEG